MTVDQPKTTFPSEWLKQRNDCSPLVDPDFYLVIAVTYMEKIKNVISTFEQSTHKANAMEKSKIVNSIKVQRYSV